MARIVDGTARRDTPSMTSSPPFEHFEIDDSVDSAVVTNLPCAGTGGGGLLGPRLIPVERRPELNRSPSFCPSVTEPPRRKMSIRAVGGCTKVKLTLGKRTMLCLLFGVLLALAMVLGVVFLGQKSHGSEHSLIDENHALRSGCTGLDARIAELHSAHKEANNTANDLLSNNTALSSELTRTQALLAATNASLTNVTAKAVKLRTSIKELVLEKTQLALDYAQTNSSLSALRLDYANQNHQLEQLHGELIKKDANAKRLSDEKDVAVETQARLSKDNAELRGELSKNEGRFNRLLAEKTASDGAQAKLAEENAVMTQLLDAVKQEKERKAAEASVKAKGQIYTVQHGVALCIEASPSMDNNVPVQLRKCDPSISRQYWIMMKSGEVKQDTMCLDYYSGAPRGPVTWRCHGQRRNQQWFYFGTTEHGLFRSYLFYHAGGLECLEVSNDGKHLSVAECSSLSRRQQWYIGTGSN